MKCVKCEGELKRVQVGGADVDQCEKCAGIWFDMGELAQVLDAADAERLRQAPAKRDTDQSTGVCPRCGGGAKLVRLAAPGRKGFKIDTCLVCYGRWLDGGEFQKLNAKGLFKSAAEFFRSLLGKK